MNRPVSLFNCFVIPVIILLLGIVFSGFYAFRTLPKAFEDDVRGLIPPRFSTEFADSARYSLWVYSVGEFDGTTYATGESLPAGARIHVVDKSSGDFLPVNDWGSQTKNYGAEKAFLAGTFETGVPNQKVDFIASGLTDKTVIGISSKTIVDHYNVYLGIFGIFLISLFLAITLLVVLLHRRRKVVLDSITE